MTQTSSLGDRLARYRKAAGLSAQTLADEIGATRAVINNIELGRREDMTVGQLVLIADALNLPPGLLAADISRPFDRSRYGEMTNWEVISLLNGRRFDGHPDVENISHLEILIDVVENWGERANTYQDRASAAKASGDPRDWALAEYERKALQRLLVNGHAAYTLLEYAGVDVAWARGDWMHYEIPSNGEHPGSESEDEFPWSP